MYHPYRAWKKGKKREEEYPRKGVFGAGTSRTPGGEGERKARVFRRQRKEKRGEQQWGGAVPGAQLLMGRGEGESLPAEILRRGEEVEKEATIARCRR